MNQADAEFVSSLQHGLDQTSPAQTRFEARRKVKRAAQRLDDLLNSKGYFAARLYARVEAEDGFLPVVAIDPGPRFSIGKIAMNVLENVLDDSQVAELIDQFNLQIGAAALPEEIIANERALVRAWRADGFPFAAAQQRDILGDEDAATVDITYDIDTGPRVILGNVKFDSESRLRSRYAELLVPFEPGTTYHPDLISELNRRLGEVRIYSIYTSRLSDKAVALTDGGDEVRDVELTLIEDKRYRVSLGASYSTSEGFGVSSEFIVRNLTKRADRLELGVTLAVQERSFAADWILPNGFGYGRDLWLSAEGSREETDAFDSNAFRLSGGIDYHFNKNQTYTLGLSNEFLDESGVSAERNFHIVNASLGASFDYTDNRLDPTNGWRADLTLQPGYIFGDENTPFVSGIAEASTYVALNNENSVVAAARGQVGLIYGTEAPELPASCRLYAGGGGSARGFAYQAIGPKQNGDPAGGRSLLEFSGEMRWRASSRFGYAAFVDAASVSERDTPSFKDMRFGVGLGARYYTPIGPIRLDIATPTDSRDGEERLQVYISIGQAF